MQPQPPHPPYVDDTLPWWPWELGSLTDLISIGLGLLVLALTLYIAFRQLRIMNKQTELAEKQMKLTQEQAEASKRMEKITKRQGEIAEIQHDIMQEQLGKRAKVEIVWGRIVWDTDHEDVYRLEIWNHGTKGISSLDWELIIPDTFMPFMRVVANQASEVIYIEGYGVDNEEANGVITCRRYYGQYTRPIFPKRGVECATLRVKRSQVPDGWKRREINVWSRTAWEDGNSPPEGLEKMVVQL
jgi:hypothetical protein